MIIDTVEFTHNESLSQCQNITDSIIKYFLGVHKCTASPYVNIGNAYNTVQVNISSLYLKFPMDVIWSYS